jgi:hypothetical protein
MKQAISGAITNRKRNHENDGQKQGQKRRLKIHPKWVLNPTIECAMQFNEQF